MQNGHLDLNLEEDGQQQILLMASNHRLLNTMIFTTSVCLAQFIKLKPTVVECQYLEARQDIEGKVIFNVKDFIRESRVFLILALLLFFPVKGFSQRKADIGLSGSTSFYMGDLNPSKYFYKPGYAFGAFYRRNFEPRNSIRLSGNYHTLNGSSIGYGDPYVESLNTSFTASFIDVSANYEINFVPYKSANRKMNKSLYLTAGLGYNFVLTSSVPSAKSHIILPFGIGYKINTSKKMSAGVELTVRKAFTDSGIDGVTNIASDTNNTLFGNKDWYTFAGIFISYKIFNYRDDCPAYE